MRRPEPDERGSGTDKLLQGRAASPVERSTTLTSGSRIATAAGEAAGDSGWSFNWHRLQLAPLPAGLGPLPASAPAMAWLAVVTPQDSLVRRTLHRHRGLRRLDNGFRRLFHGLADD